MSSTSFTMEMHRESKTPLRGRSYVLMTAAHNEQATIRDTIESVLAQTLLPVRWVIASDNSSDETDAIVKSYLGKHDFMRFLRTEHEAGRSFASKVIALRKLEPLLEGVGSDFIGNLDADVRLEPSFFQDLVEKFEAFPEMGLAGGFVYEDAGQGFCCRRNNSIHSVPHAAQLLRRDCYRAMGGYAVLRYGGEDWHAQTSTRMMGWSCKAFPELKIFHARSTGSGSHVLRHRFQQGRMDYALGSYPLFELLKCLRRIPDAHFLGGITRLMGFVWSSIRCEPRPVSNDFMKFLRNEQKRRLSSSLTAGLFRRQESAKMSGHSAEDFL